MDVGAFSLVWCAHTLFVFYVTHPLCLSRALSLLLSTSLCLSPDPSVRSAFSGLSMPGRPLSTTLRFLDLHPRVHAAFSSTDLRLLASALPALTDLRCPAVTTVSTAAVCDLLSAYATSSLSHLRRLVLYDVHTQPDASSLVQLLRVLPTLRFVRFWALSRETHHAHSPTAASMAPEDSTTSAFAPLPEPDVLTAKEVARTWRLSSDYAPVRALLTARRGLLKFRPEAPADDHWDDQTEDEMQ